MSDIELKDAEDAVKKAEAALVEAQRKASHMEFPKWIEPHASHIKTVAGHGSVPHFPEHHVDREGKVTVLVHDADHAEKALSAKGE